ncbi:type II toxin-antitoxin system Phd/YefM family antitoxin [Thalassospira xiamenensis]|jgi:hypothetical protein|uniref:type II toxin-antitoxin system Phd/YefM family antitoxin n=1 Tax=Thalassospira xiamenensis TaxID=220697 RepID=UPI000DEDE279|nr:type II toxin-antitoxin system Phd/YefM family antitoxin [Thalassospira xiamenensis]RCK37245.1 hypothetical protein TH24_16850 [Thalassospira xiamenensis]
MQEVSATQLAKKFGAYSSQALVEPLSVTSNGRAELVLMSRTEFLKLRRGYRESIKTVDLSEKDLNLIMKAEPAAGSEQYDHEVTD